MSSSPLLSFLKGSLMLVSSSSVHDWNVTEAHVTSLFCRAPFVAEEDTDHFCQVLHVWLCSTAIVQLSDLTLGDEGWLIFICWQTIVPTSTFLSLSMTSEAIVLLALWRKGQHRTNPQWTAAAAVTVPANLCRRCFKFLLLVGCLVQDVDQFWICTGHQEAAGALG